MSKLRRVKALGLYRDGEIKPIDAGKPPELRWVSPTDLYVDSEYQRDLRKRSILLIDRIVKGFVWRKLKPPIVVEVEDNGKVLLHCIDGQHTAIAAATRRDIEKIPVIVVEALSIEDRADSFVGHNRDRVVMSSLDIYKGLLKANDPDALDIHNVCERAGINLRQVQVHGRRLSGDCECVTVIGGLIKRWSPLKARTVLEALVKSGRTPISRVEISAVEAVMLVSRPDLTPDQMAGVIKALGDEGLIRSKVLAAQGKRPHKHLLYEAYIAILEEQNAAAEVA